ncbi:hypothetical protein R3P38DRAFT_1630687 [Favolaschia claudopus]|uniref:Uncharacterized protein n=1 Tax=Favolaschia claudopus TaxID=2862362 RepID=A0AAW0DJ22_9AGAR
MSILLPLRSSPSFLRRPSPRVLFAALFLGFVGYYAGRVSSVDPLCPHHDVFVPKAEISSNTPPQVVRDLLNGPPTDAFRDNLRDDVQYITSWPGTGYTNDLIGYMNLIYLAILTERVPVLPFFTPAQVRHTTNKTVPPIDFGVMFDVPRLSKALGKPILEWWQVKDRNSTTVDPLGCWSIWKGVSTRNKNPHPSRAPGILHLDISWTTPPPSVKLSQEDQHHAKFAGLMALTFPDMRRKSLRTPTPSPRLKLSLPPDEQLTCFDHMYWVSNFSPHEYMTEYSTGWRLVGKHLHWNPRIEALSRDYLRQTFDLRENEDIPPYIAVHVRHGDFGTWCTRPREECFAPLSTYARRVDEVKSELLTKKNLSVQHVIVTSDETESKFWDEVRGLGWYQVDHSETIERFGGWYPLILDAAIQSGGMGMVGTRVSTVSLIAAHRVEAWQGGVVRIVNWGKPGADDH